MITLRTELLSTLLQASEKEQPIAEAMAGFDGAYVNETYGFDISRSPSVRSLADDEPAFRNPLYSERDHSKDDYYCT